MSKTSVTITDVAHALSLSTFTVSQALAGKPGVSASTRALVEAKARELGYVPNIRGRMLRRKRADAVAFVLTAAADGFIAPYFLPVLNGVERELRRRELDLLVSSADPGEAEIGALKRLIDGGRVDAVIFARVRVGDHRAAFLRERHIPFTMLGRDGPEAPTPYVDVDHRASGAMATDWLIERGHRRIGLLNTPAIVHASRQREIGWGGALETAGLRADAALLRHGDYQATDGHRLALELLSLREPPTAMICGNDDMAFGAAQAIRSRGLVVGRDVSLIGCDDIPLAGMMTPPLTTFRTSTAFLGRRLAEQIADLLQGRATHAHLIVPEMIVRTSAGAAPGGQARRR